jgi:hypothetical protein
MDTPPEFFANSLKIGVSSTDFTLKFGTELADNVIIHMSPGTLKQTMLHLIMVAEAYEEVMGEIKVPASLSVRLAQHKQELIEVLRQQMEGA